LIDARVIVRKSAPAVAAGPDKDELMAHFLATALLAQMAAVKEAHCL